MGGADEEKFAFLFNQVKGPVDQVAIYSPEYSVQGHSGVRVSCSHEAVLKAFPKPTQDLGGSVDYNDLGLYFYFNSRSSRELPKYGPGMCEAIIVYVPGHSSWTGKDSVLSSGVNCHQAPVRFHAAAGSALGWITTSVSPTTRIARAFLIDSWL